MDEETINIRMYAEEDKDYVTRLMQDLCKIFNTEFDKDRWKNSLAQKVTTSDLTRMFVADSGGKVIGMLVVDIRRTLEDRAGYITNLIVAPDFRNKGVGEKLIMTAMDFLKEMHVSTVKANIRSRTDIAMKLFTKLGFEEFAVQLRKAL